MPSGVPLIVEIQPALAAEETPSGPKGQIHDSVAARLKAVPFQIGLCHIGIAEAVPFQSAAEAVFHVISLTAL
jgi:hypothetical protein